MTEIEINDINVLFNIPNNTNELDKVEEIILKFKTEIYYHQKINKITPQQHDILYEKIIIVLDYIGKLSCPLFELSDNIENYYRLNYKQSPELAKKMWLNSLNKIHKKYNILKNRCFNLLFELDELYIKINKKKPNNWNI